MSERFEGELVRLERNPWVLAGATLPAWLYLALLLSSHAVHGAAILGLQLVPIAIALVLLAWRANPWPRRKVVRVEADALGVKVDGELVAHETLKDGLVAPGAAGTKVVLHRRGAAPAVELVAQGIAEARAVLRALGFDATQSVARFRTLSRVFAATWYLFLPLLLVPLAFAGGLFAHAAPFPFLFVPFIAVYASLMLVPSRVTVGVDGIEVGWFGRRRFVRHADVTAVMEYESGFGNSRYVGVELWLESGERVRIPIGQRRTDRERLTAILERITEAREAAKAPRGDVDPSLLARGDRPVPEWVRALRSLGAGANATMRTAP
ncbi:MAG TPA: hypothetical protein VHB21_02485, partial [Minicystis sp.]|nr:hypothetical protein [Minicystis sp.]